MNSSKRENLLNLALDATEEERLQSLNLNVGYQEETDTWEVIVKYTGSLRKLEEIFPDIEVTELRKTKEALFLCTAGNQSLLHYVPLYKKNGVRGNGIEWERCDNGIFR